MGCCAVSGCFNGAAAAVKSRDPIASAIISM